MESEVEHLSQKSNVAGIDTGQSLPLPGTEAYEALPQFPKSSPLPFRRTIRRREDVSPTLTTFGQIPRFNRRNILIFIHPVPKNHL
jgi:hypothetical protein